MNKVIDDLSANYQDGHGFFLEIMKIDDLIAKIAKASGN